MFEDYLQDAFYYYNQAIELGRLNDDRTARMHYRAAIFCAASSLESFVNFIGDTFEKGNNLDKLETAFLNDSMLEISPEKAILVKKTKFNPIEHKIKFIIKRFQVPLDTSKATEWQHFLEFKNLRNQLVHPRSLTDEKPLSEYQEKVRLGLNANIDIMNTISMKLFKKPLRKNLMDLKV